MAARGSRRLKRRLRKRGLVVTEGRVTEVVYLDMLKQHLRDTASVITVRTVPAGGEPRLVLEKARDLLAEAKRSGDPYEWCCCVVDVDEHPTLQAVLGDAKRADIHVVVSNPNFELWLLWHYQDHRAHIDGAKVTRILTDKKGADGKGLTPLFPVAVYPDACVRARHADPDLADRRVGPNPSSAMPWLIDLMTENE